MDLFKQARMVGGFASRSFSEGGLTASPAEALAKAG
jgi:hypothetical protein